ncbi:MAG: GrpB family protein [Acutalibacteraceae bacterium]|nr:GrpB family protein [Acutalibacteraceae bacterium]
MSIGLKRGTVLLEDHQPEWDISAQQTIRTIKSILQENAVDICHVGSTSIKSIPAKPIIDIAAGVIDLDAVLAKKEELAEKNIIFRFEERPEHLLFVCGDFENDSRTHHIHVVLYNSKEWNDYINFSDYLNQNENAAQEYAALKKELAKKYPNDRIAYTNGKSRFIQKICKYVQDKKGDV